MKVLPLNCSSTKCLHLTPSISFIVPQTCGEPAKLKTKQNKPVSVDLFTQIRGTFSQNEPRWHQSKRKKKKKKFLSHPKWTYYVPDGRSPSLELGLWAPITLLNHRPTTQCCLDWTHTLSDWDGGKHPHEVCAGGGGVRKEKLDIKQRFCTFCVFYSLCPFSWVWVSCEPPPPL